MKSRALERKFLVCLIALLAAALPMVFAACGGGIVAPVSATQQNEVPTITSVVPDTGPPAGGKTITINGTNLASGTQQTPPSVSFGGVPATHVTVISSTQVSATIPPHAAGVVSVEITDPNGKSSTDGNAFTYTSTSPTITSVSPSSGPVAGGTAVIVTGTNFASGATISFGGNAATNVSFVSSTQLKATTPAHSAGKVGVTVTNPDGTSATLSSAFDYVSASPTVSAVSPISGPAAGGTQITITGTNFQSGAAVSIGGLAATSITVSNSTTIQTVTPAHTYGSVTVTVTNSDGQSASLPSGFTYHSVSLSWDAPTSTSVTITGYNIYRSTSSGEAYAKLNGSTPISGTTFNDSTVQGSTTYFYEVKSVDSSGTESSPDGPVQVTTGP